MTTGWFQGRRLEYNDTVTYRSAIVAAVNPEAPPQPEGERPYIGHIVDFTDYGMVGVRADGWWGKAPLYYVVPEDILSVKPYLDPTQLVARTYPRQEGERGTPYIQPNGLGRYFVARQVVSGGRVRTEFAIDSDGRLEAEATHLVRTHYWGADDDGTWYPVTRAIAAAAQFGQPAPNPYMSGETWLVHVEANQREYSEQLRQYERTYTIDDYPGLEG
jgi:hypothetical protein